MKKIIIILVSILVIIATIVLAWNTIKKKWIAGKVKDVVADGTNQLYRISFTNLEVDEVAGSLAVTDLQLTPDSLVYDGMAEADAPSMLVKLKIPSLTADGIKTPKALLSKQIIGRKVVIDRPRIELFFTNKGKDSLRNVPGREVYKQILGNLSLIKADTIAINSATLITSDWRSGEQRVTFDTVSIELFDVRVDSSSNEDTTRVLFADRLNWRCSRIHWTNSNKLYAFSIKNVQSQSDQKKLTVQQIDIDPTLPEDRFMQRFSRQIDRFNLQLKDISLTNWQLYKLLDEIVEIDSLRVGEASFLIYRDKALAPDTRNKVGGYPHQLLDKIPMDFTVRHAYFPNAYIEYKEKNEKSGKAGKIRFHNVKLRIDNITNQAEARKKDGICHLSFKSSFLNIVPFNANINFYMGHTNGRFTANGSIGTLDATLLNPLLEPLALANVESGKIQSLKFALTGSDYQADGTVTLLYNDLKIALFKKPGDEKELDKKKLASAMANLMIKDDNPSKRKGVRQASVHHKRDVNKSFFNLVWKSIFDGIAETVGMQQ